MLVWDGRHGIRTHARCYTPTAFPTRPLKPLEYSSILRDGAGGSRTHVQTPANSFVYNHRLCIILTRP